MVDEMSLYHNPWSFLQQPSHASTGITASFRSLLAAVDQGWRVEEPVQVLPAAQGDAWIYTFALTHPGKTEVCRIYVPAVSEVERFVERNHYQVVEGSFYS
jgi:hypothetical protein